MGLSVIDYIPGVPPGIFCMLLFTYVWCFRRVLFPQWDKNHFKRLKGQPYIILKAAGIYPRKAGTESWIYFEIIFDDAI